MRINARLDEDHSEKLHFLTHATKGTVSDVLKQAIDLYYAQTRSEAGSALSILQGTGFVGVAEGDEDLSVNYKQAMTGSLERKHDHR